MKSEEADKLYTEIEQLLIKESCAEDDAEKQRLTETAIEKANRLVDLEPETADAHHILALSWYHHPLESTIRSIEIRRHLLLSLKIDPNHHFANQFLGYINFDESKYGEALACFERTDFAFFESIGQIWRSLKAIELAIVCKIRLNYESFDLAALTSFITTYKEQLKIDCANTASPLELWHCTEWLYENGVPVDGPLIDSIMQFLDEIDYLNTEKQSGLVEAWHKNKN